MRTYFFILFLLSNSLITFSQIDTTEVIVENDTIQYFINMERHISLVTGGNFGGNNVLGELGISIKDNGIIGHHLHTSIWMVSSEFGFVDQFVVGPKVGLWLGGGMCMGLNLIYYSNFNHGTLRFRPEVGFGINSLRVVYGYNFLVVNRRADFINKHVVGLNIVINLKKIKDIRRGPINIPHEN